MKVNAAHLRQLRTQRTWTQEELAIAAGLNLRTVQRIENEATASLQSKKALAAALEIDASDLDLREDETMTGYEYKTIEIDPKEGFLTGLKKPTLPDFAAVLNAEGAEGWQLVQILTPDLAQSLWLAKTGRYIALLQRAYRRASAERASA